MNVMTVDVEDWYQTSDFNFPLQQWPDFERRVEHNTNRILDILDEHKTKATFFVLGCVAREFPQMVKDIHKRGHEVGSHGMWHQMLTKLTDDEIREDITSAKVLLEDISGSEVTCYRAPSWSISADRYGILSLLEELGFLVDSSFQPFRTPLSGMKDVPVHPFHPVIQGNVLGILEFPSTVLVQAGKKLPFSGGLYLRIWPQFFLKWCLSKVNRNDRTGMIYCHPWEVDISQPRVARSLLTKFTHYYNLHTTEAKLHFLLRHFEFHRLCDEVMGKQYRCEIL